MQQNAAKSMDIVRNLVNAYAKWDTLVKIVKNVIHIPDVKTVIVAGPGNVIASELNLK